MAEFAEALELVDDRLVVDAPDIKVGDDDGQPNTARLRWVGVGVAAAVLLTGLGIARARAQQPGTDGLDPSRQLGVAVRAAFEPVRAPSPGQRLPSGALPMTTALEPHATSSVPHRARSTPAMRTDDKQPRRARRRRFLGPLRDPYEQDE